MEKMTRMSKYKDLRESLKNDVVTSEETKPYVPNQEIVKDANYYRNLVGDDSTVDKQVEIKKPASEDTLYESLTFDTIKENETEEVKSALDKVRVNNGQEQYNTRMDILNKIRQSRVEIETEVEEIIDEIEDEIEEPIEEEVNRFGYTKEKVEEETEEIEEDEEEEEEKPRKRFGLFKRKEQEEEDDEIEEEDDEDEEEGSSFMIKLLNGCIIVLVLVLIGLVAFIVKEILL